jgi:hypothetical protein
MKGVLLMSEKNSMPEDSGGMEHELELLEDPGFSDKKFKLWLAGLLMPAVDPLYNRPPDDPDGGELAKLIPQNIPPNIGSIALRAPGEKQLAAI